MLMKSSLACRSSSLRESKSALRLQLTCLGGVTILAGRRLDSTKTVSWSEMPGITSTLFTRDWLLEKNRSRVFPVSSVICVGSSTS